MNTDTNNRDGPTAPEYDLVERPRSACEGDSAADEPQYDSAEGDLQATPVEVTRRFHCGDRSSDQP